MCQALHGSYRCKTRQDGHGQVLSGNCFLNKSPKSDAGGLQPTFYETPFMKLTILFLSTSKLLKINISTENCLTYMQENKPVARLYAPC